MAVVAAVVAAVVSVYRAMRLATLVLSVVAGRLHQTPVAAAVMVMGQWQSHPHPPLRLSNSSLTNGGRAGRVVREEGRSAVVGAWCREGLDLQRGAGVCVVPLRPHRRSHKDPQYVAVAAWISLRPPLLCSALLSSRSIPSAAVRGQTRAERTAQGRWPAS
jgi:hypothetical protein